MSDKKEIHIMVDIETTGLKPGCGVWQIGAAVVGSEEMFQCTVNPSAINSEYFPPLPSTIKWQREQNADNWNDALSFPWDGNSVLQMLNAFCDWCYKVTTGSDAKVYFWSKGNFDFPILQELLQFYNVPIPWHYRQLNDLRTLLNFFDAPKQEFPGAHNALQDALHQANQLSQVLLVKVAMEEVMRKKLGG